MMKHLALGGVAVSLAVASRAESPFPADPGQALERTCFQTGQSWSEQTDLRSDVAIIYGIDPGLPQRIGSWRDHGYRIHVMTGVSWGNYQDYLYGRFDGLHHEDEAQMNKSGEKRSHGGDVYYMCPGTNYGKFLCVGVQRALDAGSEAIHLEEPEFWVSSGYSEGFKREWQSFYGEPWQPPHSSVDAQWRASKLKYFLYRRALQQVFDYVQDYNQRTSRHVRCYVPTHSLLNYAQWNIVSPESSLARLRGCDGYIAQVWTGTARTPNLYRGTARERTFETAFLEYGAMQNLVRSTGRTVWYLNDPIEDNPDHDWVDYQRNWESTLAASLLQPEVWQYEVAPWPERIFNGHYPRSVPAEERKPIPPAYATELQTVMNALNDMKQERVEWDCGTTGLGLLVSDSLMFQRGGPRPGGPALSQVYGLAMPLLKRGLPVTPVQLENVVIPRYLDNFHVLALTYQGMKPLSAEVHEKLADWVKDGGVLVLCDDDSDPFNGVREWWNSDGLHYATPREHLFAQMGYNPDQNPSSWHFGRGGVIWLRQNPVELARSATGDSKLMEAVKEAAEWAKLKWRETNYLLLRRGPYLIAAGLEESISAEPKELRGHFVNLFDAALHAQTVISIHPGERFFLRDLDSLPTGGPQVLASACKTLKTDETPNSLSLAVEGVARTPGIILLRTPSPPVSVTLDGQPLSTVTYSEADKLLRISFTNTAASRPLSLRF
jgi:hypothetical protein